MLLQKRPHGPVIGMMDDLDANPLKSLLIGRRSHQVVGYERDVMVPPADRADHLEHAQRAGIPIRGGQPVIDHQNLSARLHLLTMRVDDAERLVRWLGVSGQAIAPALLELRAVHLLVRLDSLSSTDSRCQSLMMDNPGEGLVNDLVSGVA